MNKKTNNIHVYAKKHSLFFLIHLANQKKEIFIWKIFIQILILFCFLNNNFFRSK